MRARRCRSSRALARQTAVPLSIDTYKADVARAAIDAGAGLINDISGLQFDRALAGVAARRRVPIVLMHMRGRPADMYGRPRMDRSWPTWPPNSAAPCDRAVDAGVARDAIVLDPGLGFAKRAEHSVDVLAHLDAAPLLALDRPLLVGASRKSFLVGATGALAPEARDWATAAAVAAAMLLGAHMVRVHRVAEMVQVARVADRLRSARNAPSA